MNIEEFKSKFDEIYDFLGESPHKDLGLDKDDCRKLYQLATLQIALVIYQSFQDLKACIEDPDQKAVSWNNPFIVRRYPVELDWEQLIPNISLAKSESLQDNKRIAEILTENLSKVKGIVAFRVVVCNTTCLKEGDELFLLPPKGIISELEKLSEKEQEKAKEKMLREINFDFPLIESITDNKTGKKRKVNGSRIVDFSPLIIDLDNKTAYYLVGVGLTLKSKPTRWNEKQRQEFWEGLLERLRAVIPEEMVDLEHELETLPEPIVKAVSKETSLFRASLHAELQKFGQPKKEAQLLLFNFEKAKLTDGLPSLGLDLSLSQNKALHAIQKLLNDTNYKGNLLGTTLKTDENAFKYMGFLPQIEFTPAQYLEAYGVGKRMTSRGYIEFNANERSEALKALYSLSEIKFKIAYKKKYWIESKKGKKEERTDAILTTSPIIKMMWGMLGMTKEEEQKYDSGQFTKEEIDSRVTIGIEPCPMLVDQIDNYFVLKPASLFNDIKGLLGDKHSQSIPLFIEWLIAIAEIQRRGNTGWTVRINFKRLAEKLRLDSLIATRQWKRIKKILQKCYETAKQLGYLLDYKTVQGVGQDVEEFILNSEKFRRSRERQTKLAKTEAQEVKEA